MESHPSAVNGMKKTILVADDDEAVRQSLRRVLSGHGYEVVLAADGQSALEQFDPGKIDLLLLDLDLPVRNGWDTFARITSESPTLPVIIITGQSDQLHIAVAAGAGAL